MHLDRREFVTCGIAAAAALATPAGAAGRYSIGCWTRPWTKVDYPVALDGVAAAGFRYVGLMTMTKGGKPAGISWETTPEHAAGLGAEAKKRGLRVISVWGGGFPFQKSMADGVAGLRRLVDNCVACGSPSLLLGGVSKPEQTDPYYQVVKECCAYAASKKVELLVKPHGGTNSTGADCRKIIERVKHKNFRIFYDPGNIYYYSDGKIDPVDDAPSVDGLVGGFIIKDFKLPKEVMVTPGTGMVKFKEVFAKLRKGGFKQGPIVVECLNPGDAAQTNAEAKKTRLFVESLVKG